MYGADTSPTAEEVYLQYRQTVYRLAAVRLGSGFAAEDAVQEVFLRYIRSAPLFTDEEHRKAWLIRTALNYCRSARNTAWARHAVPLEEAAGSLPLESVSDVYRAVLELPEDLRTVIHLHYYEGYPVKEIAALTSTREATVKTRLFRARERLRQALSEDDL